SGVGGAAQLVVADPATQHEDEHVGAGVGEVDEEAALLSVGAHGAFNWDVAPLIVRGDRQRRRGLEPIQRVGPAATCARRRAAARASDGSRTARSTSSTSTSSACAAAACAAAACAAAA